MKLNNTGKSPVFFIQTKNKIVSDKLIKDLIKYSKKKNCDSRICLHNVPFKKTQYMIICKLKKTKEKSYKHNKNKFFLIISGKLQISYNKKKTILSKNNNLCLVLKKNTISKTKSLSNKSIYLEVIIT